jgi:hypothetical protein
VDALREETTNLRVAAVTHHQEVVEEIATAVGNQGS